MSNYIARSSVSDYFQNFRFHIVDTAGVGGFDIAAGFTKITIPNLSLDAVDYREGVFIYTQKQPGIPKIGDCELTKGVAKKDSDFFKWIQKPINGGQNYRSDLVIMEYQIDDEFGINGTPSRTISLFNAFPIDFKPASDLDASQNDIAVTTLKLSLEEFDIRLIAT